MNTPTKINYLKQRHGYTDRDLQEYALDNRLHFVLAIDKLFAYHMALNKKQQTLFETKELDTEGSAKEGRLF